MSKQLTVLLIMMTIIFIVMTVWIGITDDKIDKLQEEVQQLQDTNWIEVEQIRGVPRYETMIEVEVINGVEQ